MRQRLIFYRPRNWQTEIFSGFQCFSLAFRFGYFWLQVFANFGYFWLIFCEIWLQSFFKSGNTAGSTGVGDAVGRRTIAVLCDAYIYSSKHIFGLCIILSCISSKKYSNLFW